MNKESQDPFIAKFFQTLNIKIDNQKVNSHNFLILLERSVISEYCLLFTDKGNILEFFKNTITSSYHEHVTHNRNGSKKTRVNEIVSSLCNLNAENLRRIFSLLEFMVYKIVHKEIKNNSEEYKYFGKGSDTLGDRVVLLRKKILNQKQKNMIDSLRGVRNLYAHSVLPLEDIPYNNLTLKDEYSSFLQDYIEITDFLIKYFKNIQHFQIDRKVLEYEINNI